MAAASVLFKCVKCPDMVTMEESQAWGQRRICNNCNCAVRALREWYEIKYGANSWQKEDPKKKDELIALNKGKVGHGAKRDIQDTQVIAVQENDGLETRIPMLNQIEFTGKLWKRWRISADDATKHWERAVNDPSITKGVDELGHETIAKCAIIELVTNRFNTNQKSLSHSQNHAAATDEQVKNLRERMEDVQPDDLRTITGHFGKNLGRFVTGGGRDGPLAKRLGGILALAKPTAKPKPKPKPKEISAPEAPASGDAPLDAEQAALRDAERKKAAAIAEVKTVAKQEKLNTKWKDKLEATDKAIVASMVDFGHYHSEAVDLAKGNLMKELSEFKALCVVTYRPITSKPETCEHIRKTVSQDEQKKLIAMIDTNETSDNLINDYDKMMANKVRSIQTLKGLWQKQCNRLKADADKAEKQKRRAAAKLTQQAGETDDAVKELFKRYKLLEQLQEASNLSTKGALDRNYGVRFVDVCQLLMKPDASLTTVSDALYKDPITTEGHTSDKTLTLLPSRNVTHIRLGDSSTHKVLVDTGVMAEVEQEATTNGGSCSKVLDRSSHSLEKSFTHPILQPLLSELLAADAALHTGMADDDSFLEEHGDSIKQMLAPSLNVSDGIYEYATTGYHLWPLVVYCTKGQRSFFGAAMLDIAKLSYAEDDADSELPDISFDDFKCGTGAIVNTLLQSPLERLVLLPSLFYCTMSPGEALHIPAGFMWLELSMVPSAVLQYNVCSKYDLPFFTPDLYVLNGKMQENTEYETDEERQMEISNNQFAKELRDRVDIYMDGSEVGGPAIDLVAELENEIGSDDDSDFSGPDSPGAARQASETHMASSEVTSADGQAAVDPSVAPHTTVDVVEPADAEPEPDTSQPDEVLAAGQIQQTSNAVPAAVLPQPDAAHQPQEVLSAIVTQQASNEVPADREATEPEEVPKTIETRQASSDVPANGEASEPQEDLDTIETHQASSEVTSADGQSALEPSVAQQTTDEHVEPANDAPQPAQPQEVLEASETHMASSEVTSADGQAAGDPSVAPQTTVDVAETADDGPHPAQPPPEVLEASETHMASSEVTSADGQAAVGSSVAPHTTVDVVEPADAEPEPDTSQPDEVLAATSDPSVDPQTTNDGQPAAAAPRPDAAKKLQGQLSFTQQDISSMFAGQQKRKSAEDQAKPVAKARAAKAGTKRKNTNSK